MRARWSVVVPALASTALVLLSGCEQEPEGGSITPPEWRTITFDRCCEIALPPGFREIPKPPGVVDPSFIAVGDGSSEITFEYRPQVGFPEGALGRTGWSKETVLVDGRNADLVRHDAQDAFAGGRTLRLGGFLSDTIARHGGGAGADVFDADAGERAAIYLTNALTGWAAPAEPPPHLAFPEFEAERDAAASVKQERPILVVLGNPPYNAFAGVTPPGEEKQLVEPYKTDLTRRWGIEKYNLDDLYVRFFRVAENRIKATGAGVVCFISNNSFTTEPSFAVMREELWSQFDRIIVDNDVTP